jgi:nucleoside-diphosphate-sugar epimerase
VLEVGVKGIVNVLDACLAENIGELHLVSSSEVYQTPPRIPTDEAVPLSIPDPLNPRYSYAGGKIISELMALNYGREAIARVIVCRPHNVYGPDMGQEHVIPQLVARMHSLCATSPAQQIDFPIQGSGKETRAFVFVDDFIDGFLLAMEKGEHRSIYHVGSTEEVTIEALARLVGDRFGRRINIVPGALLEGGTLRRCPDIGRLSRLGYAPKVPLAEGLTRVVKSYQALNERRLP